MSVLLTAEEMTALAQIARDFVEANEQRNPQYKWATLREHIALESLRNNIASLCRAESPDRETVS